VPLLFSRVVLDLCDPVPRRYAHGGDTILVAFADEHRICQYVRTVIIRNNFQGSQMIPFYNGQEMRGSVRLRKLLSRAFSSLKKVKAVQ
jgi:hypothetical protein